MRKIIIILSLGILGMANIGIPVTHSQEYTVAIPEIPYYPYYQQEEGDIIGFIPELVRKFARDIGIEVTLRALPVRRYYLLFFEGEIDFVVPDTPYWSPDLKEGHEVIYSQPFMQGIDGLLVQNELKDKGIDAIEKVGTLMGFTPWAIIDQINAGDITIWDNANLAGLLSQVLLGRIDAAYISVPIGLYYARHHLEEGQQLAFARNMPFSKDEYTLSTIKHPHLIERFNQWLAEHAEWIQNKKREMEIAIELFQ